MQRVLIIEDSINDLVFYRPLFSSECDVSLVFVTAEPDKYTKEKIYDMVSLMYEDIAKKISHIFAARTSELKEFLTKHPFDLYIIDSLSGVAGGVPRQAHLSTNAVAFFTSTGPFRERMRNEGYHAFKKNEMETLLSEFGLLEKKVK